MTITNVKSLPDFKLIPYKQPPTATTSSTTSASTSTSQPVHPNSPLKILRTSSWTYCGPLLNLDSDDINFPPSYHTWHDATVSPNSNLADNPTTHTDRKLITLLKPFLVFAHEFIRSTGLEHYWLTIRATLPTDDYNLPRWHTDDDFFDTSTLASSGGMRSPGSASSTSVAGAALNHISKFLTSATSTASSNSSSASNDESSYRNKRTQWKLAGTLIGPGTLFADDGSSARNVQRAVKLEVKNTCAEHTCTSVVCLGCASMAEHVREKIAERLKDSKVVQAGEGDCCFFKVGQKEGAVHSEPKMQCERVFVNIVPGKEEELREVMSRWGMEEFPRAWCLGIPLGFEL
ncbi:hypothetical protein H072_8387 [Dactylellina haptotyla CBS 200.50]|uniref:Uncharacterized protein n=1 Tax=Dactylellina haptotyla (strain CBS 200.50) TaxID=1284197 RepID=S8A4M0_DACHA|nr:hypothetical protein H072_8387 [Dactylellina haptotyla CBS 200.50]